MNSRIRLYCICSIMLSVAVMFANARGASAQALNLPWVRVQGTERLNTQYTTIVNSNPGGHLVQGSDAAQSTTSMFQLQLPFRFKFMGDVFQRDEFVWVSITGVLRFTHNSTDEPGVTGGYNLAPNGDTLQQRLLMPYWGSFTSGGVPDGGIYVWHDKGSNLSSLNDDVLVIEWNVLEESGASSDPFRFQCRLRADNIIEFAYDRGTSDGALAQISGTNISGGAAVGIKNVGQGPSPCSSCTQPHWNNSLLLTPLDNDNYALGLQAVTEVPTYNVLDNYAGANLTAWENRPSPYFHYAVPTGTVTGYRIKPVQQDIGPDTGPLGIVRACGIYNRGERIRMEARFINFGDSSATAIPVKAVLRHVDSTNPGAEVVGTVTAIPADSSVLYTFADSLNTGPLSPGTYRLCVTSSYEPDEDRTNDTVCTTIYIRAVVDAKALCIIEPKLVVGGPPARYPINKTVPVMGCFCNAGLERIAAATAGYKIFDAAGDEVHSASTSLSFLEAGDDRSVTFNGWVPTVPGLYYVHTGIEAAGDMNRENDSLRSFPRATGTTHFDKTLPRVPFLVVADTNLGIGEPGRYRHSPVTDTVTPGVQSIAATLTNDGASDARDALVHVTLEQPSGPTLRDTVPVAAIAAGAFRLVHFFPSLTLSTPGAYDVTAWIHHPGDSIATNDTLRWTFRILDTVAAIAADASMREKGVMTVIPNPARGSVTVGYYLEHATACKLTIQDIYGSTVRTIACDGGAREQHARFSTSDLASGLYLLRMETASGMRRTATLIVQH